MTSEKEKSYTPGPSDSKRTTGLSIHQPAPDDTMLAYPAAAAPSNKFIRIKGQAQNNGIVADEVRAEIVLDGTQDPGPNSPDSTKVEPLSLKGEFDFDMPGDICDQANQNYRLYMWARYGNIWSATAHVRFNTLCDPVTHEVSAGHCLWFAWAPSTGNSPVPCGPASDINSSTDDPNLHRPGSVDVPVGANKVTIEVTDPTASWGHNPNNATDANGRTDLNIGLESHVVAGYKNAALHSNDIEDLTANVNKLVAMFQLGNGPDGSPIPQHQIGLQAELGVDERATKLFLGMHDGREWNNNHSVIEVSITWDRE